MPDFKDGLVFQISLLVFFQVDTLADIANVLISKNKNEIASCEMLGDIVQSDIEYWYVPVWRMFRV